MGSRIDRRFDYLRQQAEQGANAQAQKAQDDLTKQAAASGRLGSGSFQRQQMAQEKQTTALKQNAINDVESQREAALAQQEEADKAREFAKSERLGSQEFATSERAAQQQYATGEAQAQRAFQSAEAATARGFDLGIFNKQMAFNKSQASTQGKQFAKQMDLELKKFKLDEQVSMFNEKMARKALNKKGLLEQAGSDISGGAKGAGGAVSSLNPSHW